VALVAVASLALGIGANTAIFSVANAVILRSMLVEKPNELILLRYATKKGNIFDVMGYPEYAALRDSDALAGLAGIANATVNLSAQDSSERVSALVVTGNFFEVVGSRAHLGRTISAGDDTAGDPVCMISYDLWQRRFGSATDVVGQRAEINGLQYRILGVAARGFDGVTQGDRTQVYVPMAMAPQIFRREIKAGVQPPYRDWTLWMGMMGRLKPGVTAMQAQAVLDSRFATLPIATQNATFETSSRHTSPGPRARLIVDEGRQGYDRVRFQYERPLMFLLFLVGMLLLIACANVAGLLVARAAGQRRQIAIRLALGAGRWALIRQQLAESALLAIGGAGLGLLLSVWTSDLLVGLAPQGRMIDARPDWLVLGFLIAASCATVLLFGIAPALESGKTGVGAVLKSDSSGAGRRRGALAPALVILQVAISITLLGGAGLLVRSLHNLRSIPLGFQPENVVVATFSNVGNRYTPQRLHQLTEDLISGAETIPGVKMASAASVSPLSGALWLYSLDVPGYFAKPKEQPMTYVNAVGPNYFATLGTPVIRGREFTLRDREGAPNVAIVNELMAKKFWPGRDPIGQHFKTSALGDNDTEVVGVVRDTIYRELKESRQEILYVPFLQGAFATGTLHVRIQGDPVRVFADLREKARAVDRATPLYAMKTLETQIDDGLSAQRLLATVSTVLGGLAIVLAMVGLYSVLANAVAARAREIGIRMALGAARNQVIAMVLRDTLWMVLVGIAVGLPVALGTSRWIGSYLYEVKANDPVTYFAIGAMVVAAGLAAAMVPSRRASRVDPMVVLRCD
jgi:predicted permease